MLLEDLRQRQRKYFIRLAEDRQKSGTLKAVDSRTLALENKMGARLSRAAGTGGISPGRAIRVSHVAIQTLTLGLQSTLSTFQLGDFKWHTRIKTKSQHIKEVGSLAGRQASFLPFTMVA